MCVDTDQVLVCCMYPPLKRGIDSDVEFHVILVTSGQLVILKQKDCKSLEC